jgi:preprotein translocase subunit SecY
MFTLFMLVIYRLGTWIPLPSIDPNALRSITEAQAGGSLGIFNMFAGGALGRMSIFALNIMPYITASIIMQLMTVAFAELAALKKDGESGRQKISQYTKYLTVVLALFQGYGIAVGAEYLSSELGSVVTSPGLAFRITAMISLMGGTMFVMWVGDQISGRGIGNGSSIIIFCGIVSELPTAVSTFFELGKVGSISTLMILFIIFMAMLLVVMIIFMEKGQRKVMVQYPKRQVGNKIYKADSMHLPLRINTAGVIPPIFANAILSFPLTIAGFAGDKAGGLSEFITTYLSRGKLSYILLNVFLIAFFSYFYSSIVFNSEETADSLRKNGGVILSRRPGKHTAEGFDYIISRLTVIGIMYISFVCILPDWLCSEYHVPFYLGGTSLMIVINVVIDLFTQIQTHMLNSQYSVLIKKSRMAGIR